MSTPLTPEQREDVAAQKEAMRAARPVQQPAAVVGQEPVGEVLGVWHRHDQAVISVRDSLAVTVGQMLYTAPVPSAGELPIELQLPAGDARTAKVVHQDIVDGVHVICITVSVPAAGVQGNVCPICESKAVTLHKSCRDCGTDYADTKDIRANAANARIVQPDSGRDAALWTCRKMHDLGSIYDSKGELVANTYYQCANGITEAHNAAIRALAAHPAPSSDAGLGAVLVTPQEAAAAGIECGDTACGGCNAGEPWCMHAPQAAHPAPSSDAALMTSSAYFDRAEFIEQVVLAVCEIPDRNSPEDEPEMMLVTDQELRDIMESEFELIDERANAAHPANGAQAGGAISQIIDHIADNWPMKKYALDEIEDRLRAFAAAKKGT